MDEENSVLTCNQANIILKQDFQSNGGTENPDHAIIKHYTRDILLQLRLHPLSLQKPVELPEMEFIKDKLYLNDITDMTSATPEKQTDASNCQQSVKGDCCNLKPEYTLVSPYFSRTYPYCYSTHGYNGLYQTPPVKHRSTYNTYCNPLKKHRMISHQYLKDFCFEECPWAKSFSSDDIWNCYSNNVHSGCYKKEECIEAVPKCRKKLPIIDPVTGKNVLETIDPNELEQNSVTFNEENSKAIDNCININKFCGDYLCNTKESNDDANIACNSVLFSSPDKASFEESKDRNSCFQDYIKTKSIKNGIEESVVNDVSSTTDNSKGAEPENQKEQNGESFKLKNNAFDFNETSEKSYKCDLSNSSKQAPKLPHNKEASTRVVDVHSTCRIHSTKQCHVHVCSENIPKQNDAIQVRQLKEKIYSLKQEEQKIAILQSFLRYKKYQLEESVRNLNEKRIKIENWEYNLYNKAKRLQEKEQLLENKNELLNNRAQLAEKERILNEEKIRISDDILYSNTSIKAEKKFTFDNNHAIWNEISKMKNPRMDENNEYSFVGCDSSLAKGAEGMSPNVEKGKPNSFSLDELEQNLAFIEKMHSSDELIDNSNKIETAPSVITPQKNYENASYDPFAYSKGRSYLPERVKYWLDKRDKNDL